MSFPPFWSSALATLLIALSPLTVSAQTTRLGNLSTKGQVTSASGGMVTGFIVGAGTGETILIRAAGPTLAANFGIPTALTDPVLTLFSGSTVLATNSAWKAADLATMTAVGAFPFLSGSKDADLVMTALAPGTYTAQVLGAGGAADSGISLLEVYEVGPTAASSHLMNISSRVFVGTGVQITTAGFILSAGSGTRTVLIRAIGPSLTPLGVTGALADPALSLLSSTGASLATNDDWGSPVGAGAASAATLSAAFAQSGAFTLGAGSKDSALIATLAAGSYSVNVTGNSGSTGVALVEIYDITPSGPTTVAVVASNANADTSGSNPGVFTISRTGDTSQPLTVIYGIGGTAVSGIDYAALPGFVTIPAGATSVPVSISPYPSLSAPSINVILTLTASSSYGIAGSGAATVNIANIPASLYVANLRPTAAAATSTGSGTASILLSPDGSTATVNLSFSNLTSAEGMPHLVIGVPGGSGTFVFSLPYGQFTDQTWTFTATGADSSAALLAALKSGNIFLEIDSTTYPGGELEGAFSPNNGTHTFVVPAAPPAVNLNSVSPTDASRFLAQATFGPSLAGINSLVSGGYTAWFAAQMAAPATSQLAATRADALSFPNTGQYPISENNRQAAWWKLAVTAPDQLRQRVAFALSEIFVVSDVSSLLTEEPEALANYNDLLAADAFGNYRQLLQDVTLSPVMGNYLSMLRNTPANPAKGTSADENYAREIQQLFTVGLNQLNPDGSLALDATGLPIPTYNQTEIVQTANVLTGWSYHSTLASPSFTGGAADWYNPMQLFAASHDNTQKSILGGVIVPASEGGAADLKLLLDTLFNHPNTGPFFCRQLIERLVSSNPSPGYIYRVAQVFANDGTGSRGNIGAVVKAILLDPEARLGAIASNAGFGKLKEPLLRLTGIYRAFNAAAINGRYGNSTLFLPDVTLGEGALRAPTVFNFFLPDYVYPGALAQAGLYAPEFQITTASSAIIQPNTLYAAIFTAATPAAGTPILDLSALTSAPDNPTLVSTLNLLLCGGAMPTATQQSVVAALAALPGTTLATDRAKFALELVATAPAGAIQQ
jgi:uncharacterized protein (DUF1800 family)